jgi:TRAP-type C4-dicarboxylate transport system permease small subunit
MTTTNPSLLTRLCGAMTGLAGLAYLAMTGLIVFDIVARRFLGFSTEATVELTGYLLALGMSAGLAGTLVQRAHVRIDVVIQKLGVRGRAWMHALALACVVLTASLFSWGAWKLVSESWMLKATDLSSMHTPLWIPQGAWWLGLCLFTAVALVQWFLVLHSLVRRDYQRVDDMLKPKSCHEEAEETLVVLAAVQRPGSAA